MYARNPVNRAAQIVVWEDRLVKAIIWTRSEEDWDDDKAALEDAPYLYHWPMLSHKALSVSMPSKDPQFLLITSQKAILFAQQLPRLHELLARKVPALTFGGKTCQSLKALGYHGILIRADSGQKFAKRVEQLYPPCRAWYLCSDQPASELDTYLNKQGWQVDRLSLYQTIAKASAPSPELKRQLTESSCVICFTSPSAVRSFADYQMSHPQLCPLNRLAMVAIGETTAAACQGRGWSCELSPAADLSVVWATAKALAMR